MKALRLNAASTSMAKGVGFVLAIPILEPDADFTSPEPVSCVLYIDSEASGFYVEDDELQKLVETAQLFFDAVARAPMDAFDRVYNMEFSPKKEEARAAGSLTRKIADAVHLVSAIDPPKTYKAFQFNFDYSDFVPLQG
jgi:hypothetical protein